jgi:hypothetical protein
MKQNERAALQFVYKLFDRLGLRAKGYMTNVYMASDNITIPWIGIQITQKSTNSCNDAMILSSTYTNLYKHYVVYSICASLNRYRGRFKIFTAHHHILVCDFTLSLLNTNPQTERVKQRKFDAGKSVMHIRELSDENHLDIYEDSYIMFFMCVARMGVFIPKDLRKMLWQLVSTTEKNLGEMYFDYQITQPWQTQSRKKRKLK